MSASARRLSGEPGRLRLDRLPRRASTARRGEAGACRQHTPVRRRWFREVEDPVTSRGSPARHPGCAGRAGTGLPVTGGGGSSGSTAVCAFMYASSSDAPDPTLRWRSCLPPAINGVRLSRTVTASVGSATGDYERDLATTRNTGNCEAIFSNWESGASLGMGRCGLAPGARFKYAFSTGARWVAGTSSRRTSSRRP